MQDSVQFGSVAQLCPTFCDPMDCSMPGFPVHRQLPELTQIHVHCISDDIQPVHPVSSPSPPAFNLSQHQGLFQWVSSLHQVAKVLAFQLQHQFWTDIQDWFPLGLTGWRMQGRFLKSYYESQSALIYLYKYTLFLKISFYWSIVDFQCHINFYSTAKWLRVYICSLSLQFITIY